MSRRRGRARRALVDVAAAAATLASAGRTASAARPPRVIVVDDSVRIAADPSRDRSAIPPSCILAAASGASGSVVELTALAGETVAFQVVIEAGDEPLEAATVELASLAAGPRGPRIANAPDAAAHPSRYAGRWIERFVEPQVPVVGRTRNARGDETIGWLSRAARPPDHGMWGPEPDPLIPVELAPPWSPYPLRVPAHERQVVWIDITVPPDFAAGEPFEPRAAPAGSDGPDASAGGSPIRLDGALEVRAHGRALAMLPIALVVKPALLPFAPVAVHVYYDPEELSSRLHPEAGAAAPSELGPAELQLLQLFHRHHLWPLPSVDQPRETARLGPALDGTAFTPEAGYDGPGPGLGVPVVAIGAYGSLGDPKSAAVERARAIVAALGAAVRPPPFAFLYAVDEQCDSPRPGAWRRALDAVSSTSPSFSLAVGETCDRDPSERASDLVMMSAAAYDPRLARRAAARGKQVWIYNGVRPKTGSLVLDAPLVDLVANGWIAAAFAIEHWFYWEATFWNDDNRGGLGPIDPFATTESFHNAHGDIALGDGLLVYPGRQAQFPAHSAGFDGVFASMRLKSLRRGIEDAGYVALAGARDPAGVARLVATIVPRALGEARADQAPGWPEHDSLRWRNARRELWSRIDARPGGAAGDVPEAVAGAAGAEIIRRALDRVAAARPASGCEPSRPAPLDDSSSGGAVLALVSLGAAAFALARRRRARGRAIRMGAT